MIVIDVQSNSGFIFPSLERLVLTELAPWLQTECWPRILARRLAGGKFTYSDAKHFKNVIKDRKAAYQL